MKISTIVFSFLLLLGSTVLADTHYVDITNATPAAPYTNWVTAATTIQDAVDAAVDGDTVLITNGHYRITEQIRVVKGITVQSVNGPEVTIVDASAEDSDAENLHGSRVFYMCSKTGPITLAGLTITGGHLEEEGGTGAGILAQAAPEGNWLMTITNCIVENNESFGGGGGISLVAINRHHIQAIVEDCTVRNNRTGTSGGGIRNWIGSDSLGSIIIRNSTIAGNVSSNSWGGGISASRAVTAAFGNISIEDCVIDGNYSGTAGGGVSCTGPTGSVNVSRCWISNNSADRGGGVRLADNVTVSDCVVVGNEATVTAGGGLIGGATGSEKVVNCTVVGNHAAMSGGGMSKTHIYNSIVYGNTADNNRPDIGWLCYVYNSCAGDVTPGVAGNINDDPRFVNAASNDYRLLATSPCIDTGSNADAPQPVDYLGVPRIIDGDFDSVPVVDMGAFEFQAALLPAENIVIPPINLNSRGRTPVAILSTDAFDATLINPASVRFADAVPPMYILDDLDGDGDIDLKLLFFTRMLEISPYDPVAVLAAQDYFDQFLVGLPQIRIVPE